MKQIPEETADDAKEVPAASSQLWIFIVLTISYILASSVNTVASKVISDVYSQRFAFFVDEASNALYGLYSLLPYLWQQWRGEIHQDTNAFPQSKLAWMGLMAALGTYLTAVGSVHTPGQLQTVLGQLLIPCSMIFSVCILQSRYSRQEVTSALVVFAGACVAVGPALLGGSMRADMWPPALVLFASSMVPTAYNGVYQEWCFLNGELDLFYLAFITTAYQTILSFAFMPLGALPYLSGSPQGQDLSSTWEDFLGGCSCFLGHDPEDGSVDCHKAGLLLCLYVLINLVVGLLGLALVRAGSELRIGAVLLSLASAVKLPVSTVLFSSPLLMGSEAEPIEASTWAGLFLVLAGFLWNVTAGQQRHAEEEAEIAAAAADSAERREQYRRARSSRMVLAMQVGVGPRPMQLLQSKGSFMELYGKNHRSEPLLGPSSKISCDALAAYGSRRSSTMPVV